MPPSSARSPNFSVKFCFLLSIDGHTGARNEELMTPLHIASLNLRIKIVSILLKENQVGREESTVG